MKIIHDKELSNAVNEYVNNTVNENVNSDDTEILHINRKSVDECVLMV